MNFRERMDAGEHIAAHYRAGEITRDTAWSQLAALFRDTAITDQGIKSFLDDHSDSPRPSWMVVEVGERSS
jgi:hypothetical protein